MRSINHIFRRQTDGSKQLAVLLDPEKTHTEWLPTICQQAEESHISMLLLGGSGYNHSLDEYIFSIRGLCNIPIVLFPGSLHQISDCADALLFLSVYAQTEAKDFVKQQQIARQLLLNSSLKAFQTAYFLIDGGKQSSTERILNVKPYKQTDIQQIANTAIKAQTEGTEIIYLEAGSGALTPISIDIIRSIRKAIDLPIMVGGGIRTIEQMNQAYDAGADIVVIGNHFENNPNEIYQFGLATLQYGK